MMYGYQPKMRCNSCTKQNDCKKYKDGKEACKKYEGVQPEPPKTLAPAFRKSVPMPEIKPMVPLEVSRETYESLREKGLLNPTVLYSIKESNTKQRTVLSVRDFAILYEIANRRLEQVEVDIGKYKFDREDVERNPYYQDLLRIREKLGELNIEVETPSMEVEEL